MVDKLAYISLLRFRDPLLVFDYTAVTRYHFRSFCLATNRSPLSPSGAHAREWLSPAMATFLAQKLADAGKKFLQQVAVVLVPMANPDGYEFSHTNDRLWRKNRQNTSKPECKGVDLNRNWAKSWGTSGSSSNPCADTYRGSKSFSEPETRALRDLARVWIKKFTLFLSLHTYGSYILYPWSHTQTASPRNRPLKRIARKMTKYLKNNGYKNFLVSNPLVNSPF